MATQTISKKVSLTSGATTINLNTVTVASTIAIFVGATLEHANIPAGTTITAINSFTSITMSANALATSSGQTIVALNPDEVNIDDIALYGAATVIQKWSSADTLTINDNIIVNVNTDQDKFWKTITINEGKLKISNTSTVTGLNFAMGRNTASTVNAITTATGKASIEILGDWISLGAGSGASGQTFTPPFRDYIPAVWVETASGSGVYEKWANITGMYGDSDKCMNNGLELAEAVHSGKYFVQTAAAETYAKHFTLTGGSSVNTSRIITVASTTGVVPGASITGTGITALSVVQRVISATQLELNLTPTTSAGPNTYTLVNPYRAQLIAELVLGDGTQGATVPTGANVRIPNIMVTDFTPANLQTSSQVLGASLVLNVGNLTIDKALFDESYLNLLQAQSVSIIHAGFALPMLISECYDVSLEDIVFATPPNRFYFGTTWAIRELSSGYQTNTWSYINDAVLTDLLFVTYDTTARISSATNVTSPGVFLNLSYSTNISLTYSTFACLHKYRTYGSAINCSANINNSYFANLNTFNIGLIVFSTSINNVVENSSIRPAVFNTKSSYPTTGGRIIHDPITKAKVVDGQKYYFKVRSYRSWISREADTYFESRTISCKPYVAPGKYHPVYMSAYNAGSASNIITWIRQDPQSGTTAWEIFRSTTEGFTARDATTRQVTSAVEATATYTDNVAGLIGAPVNGTTYYYVLRKWDSTSTVASCTGTSGQYTLTTSNNFNTARNVINCNAADNSTKLFSWTSNFITTGVYAGMPVSGTGIQAGTTVASVESLNEITLSLPTSAEIKATTIYFGLIAGMIVAGTNVGQNARIVTVDSNTQLTVDVPHAGAVSATLTFAVVTESAEQEAYTQGASVAVTNYCLQSSVQTNGSWVKTSITPTDATGGRSPYDVPIATSGGTVTTDRLVSSAINATSTQTVAGLTAATQYTASIYVRCDLTATVKGVAGALIFGTTTVAFTATNKWQRISASFTPSGTSTTFTIRINLSGQTLYVAAANVNLGAIALAPIETTTAAVTLNPASQEPVGAFVYTRDIYSDNQGIELRLTGAPTGTHWSNIYMGTTYSFTPSDENRVATTLDERFCPIALSNANGNSFDNIFQDGNDGDYVYITYLVGSSDNRFTNFTFDLDMGLVNPINASNLSNNNLFHNWIIKGFRNYNATLYPFTSLNNCSGITLQNLKFDTYDFAMNTQFNDCILKGVSGGAAYPLASATNYVLGNTTDSVAIAYTAVYDTMFNEMYESLTTGRLALRFNASAKTIKPYEYITGTPIFGNNGRLYFSSSGVSIEYTWPHKIYGVSGFRNITPKKSGLDLGNFTDTLFGLVVEYAINTGSGYGAYKEATGINLSGETVSASAGFNIKLRITSREFMKVGNPSTQFVVGETINGAISGATATVDAVENFGTIANTIAVSNRVGTFQAAENIRNGVTVRAANVATNTYAVGPSFTSYIDGLEIFTNVDQSVNYSLATNVTCTVTCRNASTNALVEGARVYILAGAGGLETEGTIIYNGLTNASGIIQFIYPYVSNQPVSGKVRRGSASPFYKPNQIVASIGSTGLDQTIFLIPDE